MLASSTSMQLEPDPHGFGNPFRSNQFGKRSSESLRPQDYAEAVNWFRMAAEQGYVDAQYHLGAMYGQGKGLQRDFVQAQLWFTLAASQGNVPARKSRDTVVKLMTNGQINKARRIARKWMAQHQQ